MGRKLSILVLSGLLCAAAGYLVVLRPDNPLTNLFRSEIVAAANNPQVIIGPYPVEKDFTILKQHRIAMIVSLLNPQLPYEHTLIETEKLLAAKHGIEVVNFPLTSVLGQRMGKEYEANALAAADAIAKAKGKVYLHCYLGVHRAKYVADLVAEKNHIPSIEYGERKGERSEEASLLDQAEAAYNAGQYQKALGILKQLTQESSAARLLRAWVLYKLNETAAARTLFTEVLTAADSSNPNGKTDAHSGLGYCALRENNLVQAQEHFSAALTLDANDPASLLGLSITHYRQQAFSEAEHHLQALLKIDPENQEAKDLVAKIAQVKKSASSRPAH